MFELTSPAAAGAILESLEPRYSLLPEPPTRRAATYYDTFDWRLHRAGCTLRLDDGRAPRRLVLGTPRRELRERLAAGRVPGLLEELPPGTLRETLAPLVEMRRLLPVVSTRIERRPARLLDKRQKTVARVVLEEGGASAPGGEPQPLPTVLRLEGLKGYERHLERARRELAAHPECRPTEGDELARYLAAVGRAPRDYESKPRVELEPRMPALAALCRIHSRLLATMERNEEGVRRNLDSEFLHDFRVAVRRTRSALTQVPKVLDAATTARFKPGFAWLGAITGPTRDLDVYLLKMPEYRASLPADAQTDLDPLDEFLHARHARAHRRLVRELDSERYADLKRRWRRRLETPAGGKLAKRPIGAVAAKRIWKAYRRVLSKGAAITPDTPAEALHRLRIDCKKLRYLIEFFRSLYSPEEVRKPIAALKRLQNNLGDFNDYEVQQETLRRWAERMSAEGLAPPATLLAMGQLVTRLAAGQAAERRLFHERFDAFASGKNRRRFERLFRHPPESA